MNGSRILGGLVCLLSACAPSASQKPVPIPEQSYVLASLRDGSDTATIMDAVQSRLLETPLSGRVKGHGAGMPGLYSLSFEGNCVGNADLVRMVEQTARRHGAIETSCVPATIFTHGEPISFRRVAAAE